MQRKLSAVIVLIVLLVGLFQIRGVLAENGFVIHKVDDNGDPVPGAIFDVYGKPEVSWTEVVKPAPCEHDPPVVKSVKAAEGSNLPESVGPFSFTMKAVDPAFPMVPESENGEKTLTIGADAPYLEGEGNVESHQDGTLLLSVEFGTITFTEEGTYDYTISENPQEGTNYEYDSNVYIVRYEVTNNNGQLEAVRTFYKNNLPVEGLESIVFENTYTEPKPETTTISGTKTWDDDNNRDGKRPESITVKVMDGSDVIATKAVTAADEWKYEFKDLPKNKAGEEIAYTVVEDAVEGYTATVDGFDIKNSYTPETTSISGSKAWDDDNNRDGKRPSSVTVRLHADGTVVDSKTVSADASGNWKYEFTDKPKYRDGGHEIIYTVTEDSTEDYQAHYESTVDGFDITNEYTPGMTEVSVEKHWEDADNRDGIRPDEVTVMLLANGTDTGKTVELSDANNWEAEFTDLYVMEAGSAITYTVEEVTDEVITGTDGVGTYGVSVSGNATEGFVITNTHTPETTTISGTKTWDDDNNRDGKRPESIMVKVMDGSDVVATKTVTAADDWKYEFKDLPKNKVGEEIAYTVVEDAVEGYTATVDGFDIKNSYTPETVDIEVEKVWYDEDMFDAEGKALGDYKRPESVTIALLDEDYQKVDEIELSEASGWKGSWTLPKKAGGQDIDYKKYTVAEPEDSMPAGFRSESGHPEAQDASGGHYRAVVLNAPYVREEYTPVEVKLFKYSEAKTIPATDAEEPRNVALPGVKFSVTKVGTDGSTGQDASQTLTTDANGKATFTAEQPDEKFVVKETETLEGYYNNGATFTIGVAKNKLESLTFDADTGKWVKTYSLYTEALMEGKSPEDLTIETPPLSDPDGNYLEENENSYILRNTPLATLVVEKYFIDAGMRTYEDAPKEFAITLSYTDAAGNAQEKKLTVDPYGEYWNSGGNPSLCRWLVPGIPYNAEVTLKESGLGKQGYALINTEAFVWRMDSNAPRYESDMTGDAKVSADKTTVTFNMPAHFEPDPAWKYSEEYGGGSLGLLGARVRFQNHYSAEIDITGTKLWRDGGRTHDNASEVALTLYRSASGSVADAEQVAGATPTWDGNKYTFSDQPISDRSGNEYAYWVIEDRVEGYDVPQHTSADGDATSVPGAPNGGLITNELTQRTIDVRVTKVWDDAFDQDGKRPKDLTLTLYRTGREGDSLVTEKVNVIPEVTKRGDIWTYTFKDVLAYDPQRYVFTYEVREETVPEGYTCTYCDGNGNPLPDSATGARNGGSIKNTHTPEKISISGTKEWKMPDGTDADPTVDNFTVMLEKSTDGRNWTATGESQTVAARTTDTSVTPNVWTFIDIPKYENGVELQYRCVEDPVPPGWTATGGTSADGYKITNTLEIVTISGTKTWDDTNNQDGIRPSSITVNVKNGETVIDSKAVSETDNWQYSFTLPKYDAVGTEISYTIDEENVDGYTKEISGYNIKNTHTPARSNFTIEKRWIDGNNEDSVRPDSLKFYVTSGDELKSTLVLSEANNWRETVSLPKNSAGSLIPYTIEEEAINGYVKGVPAARSFMDANGNTGTTLTFSNIQLITISGTKIWDDDDDRDGKRPESVTVNLNDESGNVVDTKTVTPDSSGEWKFTFKPQPKYTQAGAKISYTVVEDAVPDYTTSYSSVDASGSLTNGTVGSSNEITITNTHTPEKISISGTKEWKMPDGTDADITVDNFTVKLEKSTNGTDWIATGDSKTVAARTTDTSVTPNTWTFENLPKFENGIELKYRCIEDPTPTGWTAIGGTSTDGYKITNTLETVTISGKKTWASSTGNNDDLDTSKIPEKYNVRLEKSTDGTNWTPVISQEVSSYMAPPPLSPTDPIPLKDEWTFDNQPKYENGVELQYRCVEDPVPDGFTMSGGTKDASGKYNLTNTYTPTTGGITLNVNFTQRDSNLSWIAKTVPVTTEELVQRTIRVGEQDIEVYMYTYSNPDATTYYGDMPYNYSVAHWYDANGNELDSADAEAAALIEALRDNAVLVKEPVTRNVFGGLFKDNVTKTITVTGPSGFSKSYSIKLGENSTYQIPITDAGEYTITQELVASADINQAEFPDPGRNTGYSDICSIQTAVVNVTKDGDNFSCAMDKSKTMIFEYVINGSSKPYALIPFEWGDNPYSESNNFHLGGGTSAEGDTVTINHYMDGVSEQ